MRERMNSPEMKRRRRLKDLPPEQRKAIEREGRDVQWRGPAPRARSRAWSVRTDDNGGPDFPHRGCLSNELKFPSDVRHVQHYMDGMRTLWPRWERWVWTSKNQGPVQEAEGYPLAVDDDRHHGTVRDLSQVVEIKPIPASAQVPAGSHEGGEFLCPGLEEPKG